MRKWAANAWYGFTPLGFLASVRPADKSASGRRGTMRISKRMVGLTCGTALMSLGAVGYARADETGLASSHTLRKEGGRLCMADHFHSGMGDGATKPAARTAAAKAWADFVDFEYGSDWARFGRAASVSVKYTKAETGWTATIEARPCR